ncbi:aspartyl-phosphate phosphatase Spo0E family protein [Bacillus sp. XF8]|uniref:aspartyl-phosphate phosphatase Spo0E family protein n=2 Tax=Bacillaceae TaxID=186817 RepID=UPI0035ABDDF0
MTMLNHKIEEKKKELIHLVTKYGFNHHKVLNLSQEVDYLIYKVMQQTKNSSCYKTIGKDV